MKIYISGPITGVPGHREKFKAAADKLASMGHIPLNPDIFPEGLQPGEYMSIDLAMLGIADAIYMLPDFYRSSGSTLELAWARYANKPIFYADIGQDNLTLAQLGRGEPA